MRQCSAWSFLSHGTLFFSVPFFFRNPRTPQRNPPLVKTPTGCIILVSQALLCFPPSEVCPSICQVYFFFIVALSDASPMTQHFLRLFPPPQVSFPPPLIAWPFALPPLSFPLVPVPHGESQRRFSPFSPLLFFLSSLSFL